MRFLKGMGALLLLLVRGVLLWVLIPFAFLVWLLIHSWAQKASFRQALNWYHAYVLLALLKGPFRFLGVSGRASFRDVPKMASIEPERMSMLGMDAVSLVGFPDPTA